MTWDTDKMNRYAYWSREEILGVKGYMRAEYYNKETGEYFSLFNLGAKFDNVLDKFGLIIELRNEETDWKENELYRNSKRHVFVRAGDKGNYTYIGVSNNQRLIEGSSKVFFDLNMGLVPPQVLKKLNDAIGIPD
jgi:hypothetical protein